MFENMTQTADTYMDLEEIPCTDLGIEETKTEERKTPKFLDTYTWRDYHPKMYSPCQNCTKCRGFDYEGDLVHCGVDDEYHCNQQYDCSCYDSKDDFSKGDLRFVGAYNLNECYWDEQTKLATFENYWYEKCEDGGGLYLDKSREIIMDREEFLERAKEFINSEHTQTDFSTFNGMDSYKGTYDIPTHSGRIQTYQYGDAVNKYGQHLKVLVSDETIPDITIDEFKTKMEELGNGNRVV